MVKTVTTAGLILGVALLASACGDTKTERGLSGAGLGAAGGAVGGLLLGVDPVTGAVLGGAAGAATGVMTDKEQIDLGKPAWK